MDRIEQNLREKETNLFFIQFFQSKKKEEERRFQIVETSVKNFLFIRSTVISPVELVTKILVSFFFKKMGQTRLLFGLFSFFFTTQGQIKYKFHHK